MFQRREVSPDFQMAPITHAYGGSKTRVGRALRIKGHTAIMPLQVTLIYGHTRTAVILYEEVVLSTKR